MTPPITAALPADIEAALKEYVIQYSAFVLNVGSFDVPKAEQHLRATIAAHLAEVAAVRERCERLRQKIISHDRDHGECWYITGSLRTGDLADDLIPPPGEVDTKTS